MRLEASQAVPIVHRSQLVAFEQKVQLGMHGVQLPVVFANRPWEHSEHLDASPSQLSQVFWSLHGMHAPLTCGNRRGS